MGDVGEKFVAALAAKDSGALTGLFTPEAEFRGVTPTRLWEARGPQAILADVLYQWFEPGDVVEEVERVDSGEVAGRPRVDYTLRIRNSGGLHRAEQRAYYDLDEEGRITRMQAMCGGFRPIES